MTTDGGPGTEEPADAVAVKVNFPETVCPSAEVTRHSTA